MPRLSICAGIARIPDYLPANDPTRQEYLAIFRRRAQELVKRPIESDRGVSTRIADCASSLRTSPA
jgi:hypothetical protein